MSTFLPECAQTIKYLAQVLKGRCLFDQLINLYLHSEGYLEIEIVA